MLIYDKFEEKAEDLDYKITNHTHTQVDEEKEITEIEISFNSFGTMTLTIKTSKGLSSVECRYISKSGAKAIDKRMFRLGDSKSWWELFSFIVEVRIGGDARGNF